MKKLKIIQARASIAVKIVQLKHEAMKQELYKTFHALDEASKVVGWELAEKAIKGGR